LITFDLFHLRVGMVLNIILLKTWRRWFIGWSMGMAPMMTKKG